MTVIKAANRNCKHNLKRPTTNSAVRLCYNSVTQPGKGATMTTTMTIRLPEEEKELIRAYAKLHDTSAADVMRRSTIERIEDEFDLAELRDAMANPNAKFTPFEEVKAMFADV
jgi:predicted transcriptional regulator